MKLTKFLYYYTRYEEGECPCLVNKEDYPFEISDEEWKEAKSSSILDSFEKYIKENNLYSIEQNQVYLDLDKSYREIEVIFSFRDKYYTYTFYEGSGGWEDCENIDKELVEVIPHSTSVLFTTWEKVI